MPIFDQMDVASAYNLHSEHKVHMLNDLKQIIINANNPYIVLEGNTFYHDATLNLHPDLYTKQVNLFWAGQQAKTRICEIGFNAGHSTMLLLLGRDTTPIDFTIFDIGHHLYTKPCVNYIKSAFPHVWFEYVEGDSTRTIPAWIQDHESLCGTYDVVHVDGGHSEECISSDMKQASRLVKLNGLVIVDDTDGACINGYVDRAILSGEYKEVDVLKTKGYQHRIIQKIK
jgi:predicted O-methyltransferase YrrM